MSIFDECEVNITKEFLKSQGFDPSNLERVWTLRKRSPNDPRKYGRFRYYTRDPYKKLKRTLICTFDGERKIYTNVRYETELLMYMNNFLNNI